MTTAIILYIILNRKLALDHAMAEAVIVGSFTAMMRVLNWSTPSYICGWRKGTLPRFCRSPSAFS